VSGKKKHVLVALGPGCFHCSEKQKRCTTNKKKKENNEGRHPPYPHAQFLFSAFDKIL
jgi:hypothetical protein